VNAVKNAKEQEIPEEKTGLFTILFLGGIK
jgi:hypothetical protein